MNIMEQSINTLYARDEVELDELKGTLNHYLSSKAMFDPLKVIEIIKRENERFGID